MLFPIKKFDEIVVEMKSFGERLMPHNFPQVPPQEEENVNYIKAQEVTVDGFSLVIYYSKADWNTHYLQILQITGRYVPFLPFSLVCKIGKKFLGDKHLSYVDFFRDDKKVYCWAVTLDRDSMPVLGPYKQDLLDCTYEGFCYTCLNPSKVNFY